MAPGEKRVLVVTEAVIRKKGFFSKFRPADMIVTDRRFIFTDRKIAQKGFAAGGDLMASQYSLHQDIDALADKERSIVIPFTEIRRISMNYEFIGCTIHIECTGAGKDRMLQVLLRNLPPNEVIDISEEADLGREYFAANRTHFISMSKKIKEALPTSVVLASEWPQKSESWDD